VADDTPEGSPKIRKAFCGRCQGDRNCTVQGQLQESGSEADYYYWVVEWYILQCRGCDFVFVQTVSSNSEDYENYYDENGEAQTSHRETITYWPARSKRQSPGWWSPGGIEADNTAELHASLLELYAALENDLNVLAAIGMRTSFDIASGLLEIEASLTFEEKLDLLVENNHINRVDRRRLETLVEAGSASAHRGWRPTSDDLNVMMDVLEVFIEGAFVIPFKRKKLDEKAEQINERVPKRSKRKVAKREVAETPPQEESGPQSS